MDSLSALEISREAIYILLKVSLPILIGALSIGLIVSLFQALTQIQEPTLSFVPKIIPQTSREKVAAPYPVYLIPDNVYPWCLHDTTLYTLK